MRAGEYLAKVRLESLDIHYDMRVLFTCLSVGGFVVLSLEWLIFAVPYYFLEFYIPQKRFCQSVRLLR